MLHRDLVIGGRLVDTPGRRKEAINPYSGDVIGDFAAGDWSDVDEALEAASQSFESWKVSSRLERQHLLRLVAETVREEAAPLADLLVNEIGKPVAWAEAEVARLALTFDLAADLLTSPSGQVLPLDFDDRGRGYTCRVERFPIGPVLAIVPYNWSYNLAAHKLAPALAAGNTVVLKASRQAALSTLSLAKLIHECGVPDGVVNAVACDPSLAERAALDARVRAVSFTGSPAVGWHLKSLLPEKRVALELGGNASAIVCADADLDWAVNRIVAGGFGYAGQVCIAVQHVWVEASIADEFRRKLIDATRSCRFGDPSNRDTVCGPLISEDAAEKVLEWVDEAVSAGARVLVGGARKGNVVEPTLVEGVSPTVRLGSDEVFGPVVTFGTFDSIDGAMSKVNQSQYGIQLGLFTRDLAAAEKVYREAEVGGVIVGDYPTLRFDNFPYGGLKRSGFGREGVAYAYEEMTEPKAIVVRTV